MARASDQSASETQRLILDSGAVISLARNEKRAHIYLLRALELNTSVEIPSVVLAETVRGGAKDAPIHRVLKLVGKIPPTTEMHGRVAGELLGKARSSSTVDALIVAHAVLGGGAVILTGDPGDLGQLAARHPEVMVRPL